MTRTIAHYSISEGFEFPSRPRCNRSCIKDLDPTTVLSGASLLERHRKLRAIPPNQGMSKLDADGKSLIGIQWTDQDEL